MLRKITLLSILSLGIITNNLNAGPNRVIKAAVNTVNFVDATIFAAGLTGIVILNSRPMPLSRFCGNGACSYLMNSMIGIRILVEACRIMRSATANDEKNQKSDLQKTMQCIDGLVTSTIFSQLAFSLLEESDKHNQLEARLLIALAVRCLLHLKTTTKSVIECLR